MSLIEILRTRRSIRKYTGEEIDGEKLERILQAGMLYPSSKSRYPVEFVLVQDKEMLLELSKAKATGAGMLKHADAAIVVIGDKDKSDVWIEDCSIAMICMHLEAHELAVGSCWVQCRCRNAQIEEGRDSGEEISSDEFIRRLLGIPGNYEVEAMLSLGMPNQELPAYDVPDVNDSKVHRERF